MAPLTLSVPSGPLFPHSNESTMNESFRARIAASMRRLVMVPAASSLVHLPALSYLVGLSVTGCHTRTKSLPIRPSMFVVDDAWLVAKLVAHELRQTSPLTTMSFAAAIVSGCV